MDMTLYIQYIYALLLCVKIIERTKTIVSYHQREVNENGHVSVVQFAELY